MLHDALYGAARKVLGLVAYAVAIMLPVGLRTSWLNGMLGARGLRRVLHRVFKAA